MMEISLNNKGTANLLDMICLYAWVAGESGTSVRKDFPSSQHLPEEEKMHMPYCLNNFFFSCTFTYTCTKCKSDYLHWLVM